MELAGGGGSNCASKTAASQRAHGVPDFPDPHSMSGGVTGVQINGNGSTLDPTSSVFQAAQTACKKYSPAGAPNGKGLSAKDRQAVLAFAACMRTHGVPDFPDPNFNGNGFSATSGSGNEPPLFNDELLAFQTGAASPLPPFAMRPAFPASDYYGGSAPSRS